MLHKVNYYYKETGVLWWVYKNEWNLYAMTAYKHGKVVAQLVLSISYYLVYVI